MKLLVIGGTRFLGRHIVAAALARGHALTLFNRGRAGAPPPGVTQIVGDRRGDLSALAEGRWDAVIDTCGYVRAEVARMAALLHGRVDRYCFVSSVSVYADHARANDEDGALAQIDDVDTEVIDEHSYGALKAVCEAEVRHAFGAAALLLRPGLIVGPHDPTQRFSYWVARLGRAAPGEAVLVPGPASLPVQCIDARDLAAFVLDGLERGVQGVFNLTSPPGHWCLGEVLDACAAAAGVAVPWARFDVAALQAQGLEPWSDLPLVLPPGDEHAGFMAVDTTRARRAGLAIRPLAETVGDTLAWWRELPAAQQVFDRAGLTPEREAAVLAALLPAGAGPAPTR